MEAFNTVSQSAQSIATYRHPKTVFFHLLFRTLALFYYFFCTWFSKSFVLNFIIVVLLVAIDFWTVKNITGRLLVGLRWWNKVAEDGSSEWVFEAKKNYTPHSGEDSVFWWSLYLTPLIWVVFGILAILGMSFAYLLIVMIAISLSASNLMGYIKCARDAKRQLSTDSAEAAATQYGQTLMNRAAGSIFSAVSSAAVQAATAPKPPV